MYVFLGEFSRYKHDPKCKLARSIRHPSMHATGGPSGCHKNHEGGVRGPPLTARARDSGELALECSRNPVAVACSSSAHQASKAKHAAYAQASVQAETGAHCSPRARRLGFRRRGLLALAPSTSPPATGGRADASSPPQAARRFFLRRDGRPRAHYAPSSWRRRQVVVRPDGPLCRRRPCSACCWWWCCRSAATGAGV